MWARLSEWMIYDGEPPMPEVGTVLTGVGLRVRGELALAPSDRPDGIFELSRDRPRDITYQVTGRIEEPRDFEVGTGRGFQHGGVEFVVTVGAERYQVQCDRWACQVGSAPRVTVHGQFEVIGSYEWADFQLEETRSTWLVQSVAPAEHGDWMLDLASASGG
jgi:hypothetical protein